MRALKKIRQFLANRKITSNLEQANGDKLVRMSVLVWNRASSQLQAGRQADRHRQIGERNELAEWNEYENIIRGQRVNLSFDLWVSECLRSSIKAMIELKHCLKSNAERVEK